MSEKRTICFTNCPYHDQNGRCIFTEDGPIRIAKPKHTCPFDIGIIDINEKEDRNAVPYV